MCLCIIYYGDKGKKERYKRFRLSHRIIMYGFPILDLKNCFIVEIRYSCKIMSLYVDNLINFDIVIFY